MVRWPGSSESVRKFNPYHDEGGRFAPAPGGQRTAQETVSRPASIQDIAGRPYPSLDRVRTGHEVALADGRRAQVLGVTAAGGVITYSPETGTQLAEHRHLTPTGAAWNHRLPGGAADPTQIAVGTRGVRYGNDGSIRSVEVLGSAPKGYRLRDLATGQEFSESGKKLAHLGDDQAVAATIGIVGRQASVRPAVTPPTAPPRPAVVVPHPAQSAAPKQTTRLPVGQLYKRLGDVRSGDRVILEDGRKGLVVKEGRTLEVYPYEGRPSWTAAYRVDAERLRTLVHAGSQADPHVADSGPRLARYEPAKTVAEAEVWARRHAAHDAEYDGLSLESANQVNRALYDHIVATGKRPLNVIHTVDADDKGTAADATSPEGRIRLFPPVSDAAAFTARRSELNQVFANQAVRQRTQLERVNQELRRETARAAQSGGDPREDPVVRQLMVQRVELALRAGSDQAVASERPYDTVTHEIGHILHGRMPQGWDNKEFLVALGGSGQREKLSPQATRVAGRISEYAKYNPLEHFAEAWLTYHKGQADRISPPVLALIEKVLAGAP